MKFSFKDIDNPKIYEDSQVVFVTGQYPIFINMVVDMLKETCKIEEVYEDIGLLDEFGLSEQDAIASNNVDFDTFLEVSKMPNMVSRWICSVDLNSLTKKQQERLKNYIKNPSKYGLLIITSLEFREYAPFLRERAILSSQVVHLIQLSFPYRKKLLTIVKELFEERGMYVEPRAAELFVMRLSSSYNDYIDVIEKNIVQRLGINKAEIKQSGNLVYLDYASMADYLKGVENFILDDFLLQLTVPIKKDSIVKTRRIYKMETAMLNEYGAKSLIFRLRRKLEEIIEMRVAINAGFVPIGVKYSVEESHTRIREKFGEDNILLKLSEYPFRRIATLASQSSLKDWVSMKMILLSIRASATEAECEKVIHTLVNRSIYSDSRLLNNVNMHDIIDTELYELNKMLYTDGFYSLLVDSVKQENSIEAFMERQGKKESDTESDYGEPSGVPVEPVEPMEATPQNDEAEAYKYFQEFMRRHREKE